MSRQKLRASANLKKLRKNCAVQDRKFLLGQTRVLGARGRSNELRPSKIFEGARKDTEPKVQRGTMG